ncbi:hypothetical protein EDF60_1686 [Leucobacter luti]|uniref:DUF6093 family protein n=1 Tax=Leucobacter luti TaxID=340320 RepID=UPI00104403CE|nr:DUF6093 family protein [Leucobacter luti]MCW2287035.1 hypothetical protein [Leucobacter luti]TCK41260.1 hypothetical protein EDF60_1686 [Leucobacter luti]
MNLGYDIAQVLPGLRAEAESRMDDTVQVTRDGERTWDEVSGEWVSAKVVIYEGKARIKRPNDLSVDAEAGSQLIAVGRLQVHVPVGSPVFAPNDLIEVTGSLSRADQVGRTFVVAAPFDGSQTTAIRYRVEVADGR